MVNFLLQFSQHNINDCRYKILSWTQNVLNEKSIVIHAGSGRQLDECLRFCELTESTFIELATGLKTELLEPTHFPIIICPNVSILMIKTMAMISFFGKEFMEYNVKLMESHQHTKKTVPGTAHFFADYLQIQKNEIESVRDIQIQKETLGIEEPHIKKHALHKITISGDDEELIIQTKVTGHSTYANGEPV